MSTEPNENDPRWEWQEVTSSDGRLLRYVRGACKHLQVVPVETGGEVVAGLCLTCDTQLPPHMTTSDTASES